MSARSLQAMRATGYAAMYIFVKLMYNQHARQYLSRLPLTLFLLLGVVIDLHLLVPYSITPLTADAIDVLSPQFATDPAIIGKIALVRRGTCTFIEKAINVLKAG